MTRGYLLIVYSIVLLFLILSSYFFAALLSKVRCRQAKIALLPLISLRRTALSIERFLREINLVQ